MDWSTRVLQYGTVVKGVKDNLVLRVPTRVTGTVVSLYAQGYASLRGLSFPRWVGSAVSLAEQDRMIRT